MTYIRTIDESSAEGVIGRVYDAAAQRAGGVANIIKMMSLDGKSAQASINLYVSLMKTDNVLTPAQREMLAVVVSNVNLCYY